MLQSHGVYTYCDYSGDSLFPTQNHATEWPRNTAFAASSCGFQTLLGVFHEFSDLDRKTNTFPPGVSPECLPEVWWSWLGPMNELSNLERAGTAPATRAQRIRVAGVRRAFATSRVGRPNRSADLGRPRTRVYDAVRVLETKGLVEVQHTNPQQFRAVSIASSIETLRNEYDSRVESLRGRSAGSNRSRTTTARKPPTRSGRCLGSRRSSRERRGGLIEEADRGVDSRYRSRTGLHRWVTRSAQSCLPSSGVTLIVGVVSEALQTRVEEELPEAEVSVSGLDWLQGTSLTDDDTEISRLLLIDRNTILISTFHGTTDGGKQHEQAVFGRGFDNGLVTIIMTARRKPATSGAGGSRQHGHKPRSMAGRLPTPIQTNINTEHCI